MDLRERVDHDFTFHDTENEQTIERYRSIREWAKAYALHILDLTPECREQSLALTNLEQVVFWANAAIARNMQ